MQRAFGKNPDTSKNSRVFHGFLRVDLAWMIDVGHVFTGKETLDIIIEALTEEELYPL
ncbi:hypothetical protein [Paradesulfitobacterium ferrireducens]|uniref:hypothetical protein n=1 Tax=Paradesulfitobacterium ferrireducens TaxID=2816476 RepID=UPI001A8F9DC7|nr:hypothetical protein [Paradesulfitobacterium ferrireducens]